MRVVREEESKYLLETFALCSHWYQLLVLRMKRRMMKMKQL
jgi:hypothetical protein